MLFLALCALCVLAGPTRVSATIIYSNGAGDGVIAENFTTHNKTVDTDEINLIGFRDDSGGHQPPRMQVPVMLFRIVDWWNAPDYTATLSIYCSHYIPPGGATKNVELQYHAANSTGTVTVTQFETTDAVVGIISGTGWLHFEVTNYLADAASNYRQYIIFNIELPDEAECTIAASEGSSAPSYEYTPRLQSGIVPEPASLTLLILAGARILLKQQYRKT